MWRKEVTGKKPREKRENKIWGIERGIGGKIEVWGRWEDTGERHRHLLSFPRGCGYSLWHTDTAMHIRAAPHACQISFPTVGFGAPFQILVNYLAPYCLHGQLPSKGMFTRQQCTINWKVVLCVFHVQCCQNDPRSHEFAKMTKTLYCGCQARSWHYHSLSEHNMHACNITVSQIHVFVVFIKKTMCIFKSFLAFKTMLSFKWKTKMNKNWGFFSWKRCHVNTVPNSITTAQVSKLKRPLLCKIHFCKEFGHKCVLPVCEHNNPTLNKIHPLILF